MRPGHHRWIVERTLAWLARFRRLTLRYERRADLHLASPLACALICQAQAKRLLSLTLASLSQNARCAVMRRGRSPGRREFREVP